MDDATLEQILSSSSPEYLDSCIHSGGSYLPRVVISLTTVPGRYQILYDTLKTLVNQDYPVSAIYLTIPKIAQRWGTPYPALPQHILDMVTVVNIEEDYGPICKIVGALMMEPNPKTLVVTCDDDIWYSPNLVSALVKQYFSRPNTAVSGSGMFISNGTAFSAYHAQSVFFHSWLMDFTVPQQGREVDILCGFSGVLYPRHAFPTPDKLEQLVHYTRLSKAVFHNDDILLSAYLSSQGVKRVVVPDIPWVDELRLTASGKGNENVDEYALSHNIIECVSRMQVAYADCVKFGLIKDRPNVSWTETVGGKIIVLIFVLIIVIFVVWVLCQLFSENWYWVDYQASYPAAYPLLLTQVL